MARRHLFICDICGNTFTTPTSDERLPRGWAIMSGIRDGDDHVISLEVCSADCAVRAFVDPSVKQFLNPAPPTLALPPKEEIQ